MLEMVVSSWGTALIYAFAFLAVITVVVFVHELGHFLAGRWIGVAIERFSIGFGHELFGFTDRRQTRWSFAALPLGGYVKFAGDTNAASVPTSDQAGAAHDPSHLQFRPTWQRAFVIAAGPLASLLLAVVIFAGLALANGVRTTVPRVGGAIDKSPAAAAGFQPGDIVRSIEGQTVRSFQHIAQIITTSSGATLKVMVERNGSPVQLTVVPRLERIYGGVPLIPGTDGSSLKVTFGVRGTAAFEAGLRGDDVVRAVNGVPVSTIGDLPRLVTLDNGHHVFTVDRPNGPVSIRFKPNPGEDDFRRSHGVWRIGIQPPQQSSSTERVGVLGAVRHGLDQTTYILRATVGYLGDVFTGRQSADQIGGIGHMVDVAGTIARKYSIVDLIPLAAMISASVGLMNLLPFLPLDGGHLVNHAVEAVRGRPLSLRSQEVQAIFGLSLVASLFFLAFFNDLTIYHRWIFG